MGEKARMSTAQIWRVFRTRAHCVYDRHLDPMAVLAIENSDETIIQWMLEIPNIFAKDVVPRLTGALSYLPWNKSLDELILARNNHAVLVPEGYHPVVSAPGYTTYYLNFLAGTAQVLKATDDPEYAWVKDTWTEKDPRMPVVSMEMEK